MPQLDRDMPGSGTKLKRTTTPGKYRTDDESHNPKGRMESATAGALISPFMLQGKKPSLMRRS
jgi:hypothetical protein